MVFNISNSESQKKFKAAVGHWNALKQFENKSPTKRIAYFTYYAFWHLIQIVFNKLK